MTVPAPVLGPRAGAPHTAPRLLPGDPLRPGATVTEAGITFTVGAPGAREVRLVLFDAATGAERAELPFPDRYRSGDVFTMTVSGLDPDTVHYGYRVDRGTGDLPAGWALGPLLLDPYAGALAGGEVWGRRPVYRSRVVRDAFDWQGVSRPAIAPQDLVVYELHVRGYTRHPSSGTAAPGTYAALREKIPYLLDLGVNCVELLPVFEFDDTDNPFCDPETGRPLPNYWGYNPVSFFAPKASYASDPYGTGPVRELKELVREMHRAGIEVVLDVVFNHTGEGDHRGPVLSLRGLDDAAFYLHGTDGAHRNLTGTGNTVNANHPVTRRLLLDSLRHWAAEFQIDGFRFDMAPILTRGSDGEPLADPPLIEAVAHDPLLAHCKLIAEPFDASGLDLVGRFPAYGRWQEWNTRFLHTARRFLTGAPRAGDDLAARLCGSPDLYRDRGPTASVNFMACHDGFTLADWTSYDRPRNEANGEGGLDGARDNASWNAGREGPTGDPAVLRLRGRQVRNAFLLLLMASGVPMLAAGDEFGRTQGGNNNAYSQDNETGWVDWSLAGRNADLLGFVRACIAFRAAHPVLRGTAFPPAHGTGGHGAPLASRPGADPDTGAGGAGEDDAPLVLLRRLPAGPTGTADAVLLAANNQPVARTVELPPPPEGTAWRLFADTGAPPGEDVHPVADGPGPLMSGPLTLTDHTIAVLVAHPCQGESNEF